VANEHLAGVLKHTPTAGQRESLFGARPVVGRTQQRSTEGRDPLGGGQVGGKSLELASFRFFERDIISNTEEPEKPAECQVGIFGREPQHLNNASGVTPTRCLLAAPSPSAHRPGYGCARGLPRLPGKCPEVTTSIEARQGFRKGRRMADDLKAQRVLGHLLDPKGCIAGNDPTKPAQREGGE